jgi:hypothetical protein
MTEATIPERCAKCGGVILPGTPVHRNAHGTLHSDRVVCDALKAAKDADEIRTSLTPTGTSTGEKSK